MVNNVKSIKITINQYLDAYSSIITKCRTNKLIWLATCFSSTGQEGPHTHTHTFALSIPHEIFFLVCCPIILHFLKSKWFFALFPYSKDPSSTKLLLCYQLALHVTTQSQYSEIAQVIQECLGSQSLAKTAILRRKRRRRWRKTRDY